METKVQRISDVTVGLTIVGDEQTTHVSPFLGGSSGQAIICPPSPVEWRLHISGTPDSWRHLAKLIEDAAMELEAQLLDRGGDGLMHVDRYTTPFGERRERPVECRKCSAVTWTIPAVCDRCHARECQHPTDRDGIPLCWLAKEAADA